jgi:hypothetical protein
MENEQEQRIQEQRIQEKESITIWKRIKLFLMSFYIVDYSFKIVLIILAILKYQETDRIQLILKIPNFTWFIISYVISIRLSTLKFIKSYEKVFNFYWLLFFSVFRLYNNNLVDPYLRLNLQFTPLFMFL